MKRKGPVNVIPSDLFPGQAFSAILWLTATSPLSKQGATPPPNTVLATA